ncbi:MAG: chromosome partition protein Smc [Candidatus Hepatoplasma vulgare]|nr:MAG: chromosome partition protein Smc [Candidatus Hepatoplasma sp.]
MFLKKIELKGFKSFAKTTIVNFHEGLTVIVGPNGSGKSNINDAFKWVLGESSKKTLRASSSKDMIFDGSTILGPSEYAEVSLFFDNSKKILDYDSNTVVVTRKQFRNKDQNEYYINHELARRKDIKNLFMDTGLGNTNLSIISQGSVSRVTESKPDQLMDLLNEAAGVSKYQKQKKESLAKLETVDFNLSLLDTKIKLLSKQIKPLENASEKAEKYNKFKEELTKIELPLIKYILEKSYKIKEKIELELEEDENKRKNFIENRNEIDKNIKELNLKILEIEKKIDLLQLKENELQKNSIFVDKNSTNENALKEKIKVSAKRIKDLKVIISSSSIEEEEINNKISNLKSEQFDLTSKNETLNSNLNRIDIELNRLNEKEKSLGRGTREIIENKNLFNKIYGTVSSLIKYDEKYEIAIYSVLSSKLNNIVVNNEITIKEAVNFLKENKYGNATFIPAEKVKQKFLPQQYLGPLNRIDGFLGLLNEFIEADNIFKNTISSLAGNIILFDNLNNALKAANFLEHKFQFITLEGDIIYPGFTVKGGYNNLISSKERKEELNKAKNLIIKKQNQFENKLDEISENVRDYSAKRNTIQNEEIRITERLTYLESQLQNELVAYKNLTGFTFDFSEIEDFINKEESEDLSLEFVTNKLRNFKQEKQKMVNKLINYQDEQSKYNREWGNLVERIADNKVLMNENKNVIIYNNNILNQDYKLTFETLIKQKLDEIKNLEEKYDSLKEKRDELRKEISDLGYIDIDAIEKYNTLKKEHDSLKIDVNELKEIKNKLLSVIEIADKEMIRRLEDIFGGVSERFNLIFQMLFRGGNAKIILTNPMDILNSGIEIVASAPGKTIKTLSLYSGGEKALIALSLIFAINETKKLPILLLDEVEAALDEANVERFAKFAKILNETTQLIIVSHRPGTMEKADFLYGVTMQQRGITDIFNVKLQEAIQIAE